MSSYKSGVCPQAEKKSIKKTRVLKKGRTPECWIFQEKPGVKGRHREEKGESEIEKNSSGETTLFTEHFLDI